MAAMRARNISAASRGRREVVHASAHRDDTQDCSPNHGSHNQSCTREDDSNEPANPRKHAKWGPASHTGAYEKSDNAEKQRARRQSADSFILTWHASLPALAPGIVAAYFLLRMKINRMTPIPPTTSGTPQHKPRIPRTISGSSWAFMASGVCPSVHPAARPRSLRLRRQRSAASHSASAFAASAARRRSCSKFDPCL